MSIVFWNDQTIESYHTYYDSICEAFSGDNFEITRPHYLFMRTFISSPDFHSYIQRGASLEGSVRGDLENTLKILVERSKLV